MNSRVQNVENVKFGLVIVGVMLGWGLYMAVMVNYAFASPVLIKSVIAKSVR